jgi:transcriptional regulator with XRE-family HTH domain
MTTALYRLRMSRGLSLRQLAREVGCAHETLRRIEQCRAKEPWPRTRVALERYFGLPFDVLAMPTNANGDAPTRDAAAVTTIATARKPKVHDGS